MTLQFLDILREEVTTLRPPNPEIVPEFRVLLTGPAEAGKSSFVNTVSSTMSGRIRQLAMTGKDTYGITTRVLIIFRYLKCKQIKTAIIPLL